MLPPRHSKTTYWVRFYPRTVRISYEPTSGPSCPSRQERDVPGRRGPLSLDHGSGRGSLPLLDKRVRLEITSSPEDGAGDDIAASIVLYNGKWRWSIVCVNSCR